MIFAGNRHRVCEKEKWLGEAEPEPGLEEKADSRERGHLKSSIQAAHLVWGCHLLTQEIQRSYQKRLRDLSSMLFKKSDTKWQLSLSAIAFFFVNFTVMIIKESYWFWYQISHFDTHIGKVFMMLAKFLRFFCFFDLGLKQPCTLWVSLALTNTIC